jgi:hypothetical protein
MLKQFTHFFFLGRNVVFTSVPNTTLENEFIEYLKRVIDSKITLLD